MTNEHNSLTSPMTVGVPSPLHKLHSAHPFILSRLICDVLLAFLLANPSTRCSRPRFSPCQSFSHFIMFVSPPPLKISVALPPPAISRMLSQICNLRPLSTAPPGLFLSMLLAPPFIILPVPPLPRDILFFHIFLAILTWSYFGSNILHLWF